MMRAGRGCLPERGLIIVAATAGLLVALAAATVRSQTRSESEVWVTSWSASAHGPYPYGNPVAQPVLDFAFESAAGGARDQTFRLIIRPDLWGPRARLRFSNAFGSMPVTFDDVFVGLRSSAGTIIPNTNVPLTFNRGSRRVTIASGATTWSDAVALPFVTRADDAALDGRALAVSFHTVGETGPMTWHAKALTTSYLTAPGSGSHGAETTDAAFSYTTTSWFFVDALDVSALPETRAIVCFGDSITDGTASTLNGDDRWPDVLSRRLHRTYGSRVSVVNAGIGGNRILSASSSTASTPFAGGPSALDRLDRDVLSLSGVSAVVWLEGINDINAGTTAEAIKVGFREGLRRMRERGLRVIAATITSALGAAGPSGTPEANLRRQEVNSFLRESGLFDGIADFDAATVDPATGALRAAFQPNSSIGGVGDRLHPNRAGYQAMGESIAIELLAPALTTSAPR